MYLSTDGTRKSEIGAVIDQLNFTFGIRPESIPYMPNLGVRINVVDSIVSDVVNSACMSAISNLGIAGLTVINIDIDELHRVVTLHLEYKSTQIDIVTNYTVGG